MSKESHQLINQDSQSVEFYTPTDITEAARKCMGSIDYDPASCTVANGRVHATAFASAPTWEETDTKFGGFYDLTSKTAKPFRLPRRKYHGRGGLERPWRGNVWMNHPFGKSLGACDQDCENDYCRKRGFHTVDPTDGNKSWIDKAASEYALGNVRAIVMICFAAISSDWFRPLLRQPQCIPFGRVNYYGADGKLVKGVTKDSIITYFGKDVDGFAATFSEIGEIKVSYRMSG